MHWGKTKQKKTIQLNTSLRSVSTGRCPNSAVVNSVHDDWRVALVCLHCLGFKDEAKIPKIMATTVKPWAAIRPLISNWDCLFFPRWKARRPYSRAPAVAKQPEGQIESSRWYQGYIGVTSLVQTADLPFPAHCSQGSHCSSLPAASKDDQVKMICLCWLHLNTHTFLITICAF